VTLLSLISGPSGFFFCKTQRYPEKKLFLCCVFFTMKVIGVEYCVKTVEMAFHQLWATIPNSIPGKIKSYILLCHF